MKEVDDVANLINFDSIVKKASEQKRQMAFFLEELEKTGLVSEEYITYALRFLSYEEYKLVLSLIKLLLKS